MRRSVLVIAGSDSSGGAGVQADLKALDHIGVHGAAAITCLTSQSSTQVRAIYPASPGAVLDQAAAVLDDLDIEVVKCGMLYSEAVIRAVADLVEDRGLKAVVDPVLAATSGGTLSKQGAAAAYMRHLVPVAWAVTPNAHEAEAMLGSAVHDAQGATRAARKLVAAGAGAAVVKGGHLGGRGPVVDALAWREGRFSPPRLVRAVAPRLRGPFHGAGCHFASLLAGFAARGLDQEHAFRLAHGVLQGMLRGGEKLGKGPAFLATPPRRFLVEDGLPPARARLAWELAEAVLELEAVLSPRSMPEVGVNFGYALRGARSAEDVCAVDGRIVVSGGRAALAGPIRFGASRHVARTLIACAREAPSIRSACNLRCDERAIARAKRGRLRVATFDRENEPKLKGRKVSTMSWGTAKAIQTSDRLPDLIVDRGGPGKEAMVRVLGRRPADVVAKVRRIAL